MLSNVILQREYQEDIYNIRAVGFVFLLSSGLIYVLEPSGRGMDLPRHDGSPQTRHRTAWTCLWGSRAARFLGPPGFLGRVGFDLSQEF